MSGWQTLFYKEVLRFWKVSFQTVAAPVLTASGAAASIAAPELLAEQAGKRVWTIELDLRREAAAAEVVYSLGGAASWRFTVPATSERPRMAYGSCNGFSTMKLAKAQKEPFALWRELGEAHAQAPYHLLMLGGDQVYADSMWERIDELVEWSHRGSFLADLTPMSAGLADALERFYFDGTAVPGFPPVVAAHSYGLALGATAAHGAGQGGDDGVVGAAAAGLAFQPDSDPHAAPPAESTPYRISWMPSSECASGLIDNNTPC